MSNILHFGGFTFAEYLSIFAFDLISNYNEESDIGNTLILDGDYSAYLQPLHRDLPFLLEKRVINGANKLTCTFCDKKAMYVKLEYWNKL